MLRVRLRVMNRLGKKTNKKSHEEIKERPVFKFKTFFVQIW